MAIEQLVNNPTLVDMQAKIRELINSSSDVEGAVLSVNDITPNDYGNVIINKVALADNIYSPDNQELYDNYNFRTSGGNISIENGESQLVFLRGNSTITGRTPESYTYELSGTGAEDIDNVNVNLLAWNSIWVNTAYKNSDIVADFYRNSSKLWDLRMVNDETSAAMSNVSLSDYGITYIENYNKLITINSSNEELNLQLSRQSWIANIEFGQNYTSYTFTYNYEYDQWSYNNEAVNMSEMGISYSGDPVDGDTITVSRAEPASDIHIIVNYHAATIGTINISKPRIFKSTGLNSFNKSSMYLEGYSIDVNGAITQTPGSYIAYVHAVGGLFDGYTIYNSAGTVARAGWNKDIPTADTTGIDVSNWNGSSTLSYIDVEEEGYICISCTNKDVLCVHPKWSGYRDLEYEDYSEDTITLPTADINGTSLPIASYGIPMINGVADELNLDINSYVKRIERLEYSDENLATVVEMNVSYDYDENYIYYVLQSPITYSLPANNLNTYIASDFGTEEFLDSNMKTIAVKIWAENLYGSNLRDKLRRMNILNFQNISITNAMYTNSPMGIYSFRANIPLSGVDSTMYPSVTFPATVDTSMFSSVCETYDGGIWIWSTKKVAITIASISCVN